MTMTMDRAVPRGRHPAWLVTALALPALALALMRLNGHVPPALWSQAILSPDIADIRQLLVHYSVLPRIAVAVLCGAALGLAGAVFQQVLRNPIASPMTLGVAAGARMALTVATLWAPALIAPGGWGREALAVAGGGVAVMAVFGLAWRRGLSDVSLILAGMIVSLYCGALGAALNLLYEPYLTALFIWGGGSLVQQDWTVVVWLLPRLVIVGALVAVMVRPLSLFELDDEGASGLGVSLRQMRLAAMALAVALTGFVVAAVGVIGFIGLAAPALARLAGARRLRDRLIWAPLVGAALLWLTDQVVLLAGEMLPTGAVTALLGAPLLLWMLPRLSFGGRPGAEVPQEIVARQGAVRRIAIIGLAGLAVVVIVALGLGRTADGWQWLSLDGAGDMLRWRWPRVLAALTAGGLMAAAGCLMQRFTGNPMASPEVLGIGGGAAIGTIIIGFLLPVVGRPEQIAAGSAGALVTLIFILWVGRRSGFGPERVLLAGVAVGALFDALVVGMLATGDPRATMLLNWMAGSTYVVGPRDAVVTLVTGAVLLALVPLAARWLDILPLGGPTARALGVPVGVSRLLVLVLAAGLAAIATLVIGPLSFVGLMAPHIARMAGARRALAQIVVAIILGALIMVAADWLGRTLLFPRQMPAGLLAALIGGPYFMWLLRRR
ncbi:Fe(3+)-hydroxamate ABC transporter permease FhuB (plasmid) [Tistrella bauzanensis]|uniref:Fe(3+)-hydroxamate ABC transporter permease FhuB n=1 Tax=Tistrella TaxID=171436 RepID=UPI0031F5F51B